MIPVDFSSSRKSKGRAMSQADHSQSSNSPHYPTDRDDPGSKPPQGMSPEQQRAAQEAKNAANAQSSTRDRMVDIGRGNQQAGRQGS